MIDAAAIISAYCETRWLRFTLRSRAAIEARHRREFDRFSRRVLSRSPWYARYAGKPLHAYPVAGKRLAIDAFDTMNTCGLRRDVLMEMARQAETTRDFSGLSGDFSVGLSSGTSGQRGLFVASARERARYAGVLLAKALPRSLLHRERIALLFRANNPLYETAGGSARLSFRFFDLAKPFAELLPPVDAFQPTILVGPPQALQWVAEAQQAGRIAIAPLKLIAGGEVLEDDAKAAIESVFRRTVDQIYQATEGFLGITCAHGTIHLNEDYLIIEREWIDRPSGRFMPVITDLPRETQPTVRYRLDDILIERGTPCPCGSPFLGVRRIEGRADDALLLKGARGGKLVPVLPDFVRDALAGTGVGDYRVVQADPSHVDVALKDATAESAAKVMAALQGLFARMGGVVPDIRMLDTIAVDLTRKLRRIERRFALPEGFLWSGS